MANDMKNILVAGATSLIAQETIRLFAAKHQSRFVLLGRNAQKLGALAEDLRARGASEVFCFAGDLCDETFHSVAITEAQAKLGRFDLAYLAWGELGTDKTAQHSLTETQQLFQVNFFSYVSFLLKLSPIMEAQKSGMIAVISSVAGDRGRQSNYVYGSTKAALSAYLQGFRNRLYRAGVHVLTIKPGFINTPMTAQFKHGPLTATAKAAGEGIYSAVIRKKEVAYVPWFWRIIMSIVCSIPESIFKRLKL